MAELVDNYNARKEELKQGKETILEEALRLVSKDRRPDYGDPVEQHRIAARLWQEVLGYPVSAKQVVLCMVMLKLSREVMKHKRDNLADAAGYLHIAEMVEELLPKELR